MKIIFLAMNFIFLIVSQVNAQDVASEKDAVIIDNSGSSNFSGYRMVIDINIIMGAIPRSHLN